MSAIPSIRSRPARKAATVVLDVPRIREGFPILEQKVRGKPLVYLDNAATTQKPQVVLDAVSRYYTTANANVHRAVHQLSERATADFEAARVTVKHFLNAGDAREIIFVRGATEGINLVAQCYGRANFRAGDEILISTMEHHSNIVPWQLVCEHTGAVLRVVPITDDGEIILSDYEKLLSPRTKLVSIVHVSNSLGTINPVREIIALAHRRHIPVLIDGAQAVSHLPVDVQDLDCDFYVFSGHKLFGPTGIGVLYGKSSLLEAMPPFQGGGDMIASVTFAKTTYAALPNKFEAGTPDIAGAVGLGAAIDYIEGIGLENIAAYEEGLLSYATAELRKVPGVRIIGTASRKAGALSFIVEDPPLSPLDVGTQLDLAGVAVRTGHHCCQPVMDRYGITGTARASFAMYNTREEVDVFVSALQKIIAAAAGQKARAVAAAALTELVYPKPYAPSPKAAADKLAAAFEFFDDWPERYQQIIDLGKKLPPMPANLKTEINRVHGCQSTVHISARKKPATEDVLEFLADSDADLVRGLIAMLQKIFSGQRARDILDFDVEGFFGQIGLDTNLTLGRRNGLAAMVQRIRGLATALASAHPVTP
jgi:cysteine desulfurase/selenocysteine lyase